MTPKTEMSIICVTLCSIILMCAIGGIFSYKARKHEKKMNEALQQAILEDKIYHERGDL